MDVLTPRTLDEALRLKSEHPDAVPIQGGTDLMVALNFDRARPRGVLDLNEVAELRGWSRENGTLRLGAGLTYTRGDAALPTSCPALAEASRTVGSPQIRNRGTIGGNLGDGVAGGRRAPAVAGRAAPRSRCASVRGARRSRSPSSSSAPKRNALAAGRADHRRARRAEPASRRRS